MKASDDNGRHRFPTPILIDHLVLAKSIKVKSASLYSVLREAEENIQLLLLEAQIEPSALSSVALGICAVVDRAGAIAATNGKFDHGVGFEP